MCNLALAHTLGFDQGQGVVPVSAHDLSLDRHKKETPVLFHRSHWFWILLLVILLLVVAKSAGAQDAARGRELYEAYCGDCHYQRIHQRDRARSRVQALQDLRTQVARWSAQTKRSYSQQELADIVEYLNQSYYRLEK